MTEKSSGFSDREQNPAEILARIYEGLIKVADMDANRQAWFTYWGLVMQNDPVLKKQVKEFRNQFRQGKPTQLFSDKDLAHAKKHRHKPDKVLFQRSLFNDYQSPADIPPAQSFDDPEGRIWELDATINNPITLGKKTLITEEVRRSKKDLRNLIGLPRVVGKDPHIKDPFYKLLVRDIIDGDIFDISYQYDRVYLEVPEELSTRINQVRHVVSLLLDGRLSRSQKYKQYTQIIKEYRDTGKLPE